MRASVPTRADLEATLPHTTTGTALLDELIDGVHTGDNLVVIGDDDEVLDLVVARFTAAAAARMPLVRVTFGAAAGGDAHAPAAVVDWSGASDAGGAGDLPPDASLADALTVLERVDRTVGRGAAFVFDPLSELPARWGDDAALELFLATCPRLYRRRSLALWPIRRDRHRPAFLRRLAEVTQVVLDLRGGPEGVTVTVEVADGRPDGVRGRRVVAAVADGDLVPRGEPVDTRARLGGLIREQRLARGLSQAEVARRVGISPSALSQVERGVRGPSGDTLVRLWEVLEVPFGPTASGAADRGYELSRRSGRQGLALQDGLAGQRLLEPGDGGAIWALEVEPGASGSRPPFAVKVAEQVVVVDGVLELQLGGRTVTLHEGDAIELTRAVVTGWSNPGPRRASLVWILAGDRTRTPPTG